MYKNDWLDHSSIYVQQQKTFYRWILYPIIALLLFLSLFLFFGKKEVVIRTKAQITAISSEKLQVPLQAKINENQLSENQIVKQGEVLIIFDTSTLQKERDHLEQENRTLEEQTNYAQILIDSLYQEQNLFDNDDIYGYSNQLKSFMAEKKASVYTSQQIDTTKQKEIETYKKTKEQLEQELTSRKNNERQWEQVRNSWKNQQNIQDFSPEIMSKYQSWQIQMIAATEDQKEQIKSATLATIDELISQIKKEISQLQAELETLVEPPSSNNEIDSQQEKINQSKEQLLALTKQKVLEWKELQEKNNINLKNITEQIEKGRLKAPIDGTVHLNEETKGQLEIPKGTVLAEIYPKMKTNLLNFTAHIPTNEIVRVKTNMEVHFKLDKNGVATETLSGTLTEISENSITSNQGTFYIVKGILNSKDSLPTRYGLTGEISLIIGKKTYWQQIKEYLLNQ